MDLIDILIRNILSLAGIKDKAAAEFAGAVTHSLFVYWLLVVFGAALFAPSWLVLQPSLVAALILILTSLFGLSAWIDNKISRPTTTEKFIAYLISTISTYLSAVGIFILFLAQVGIISQLSLKTLPAFIFIIAFLVYSFSDLRQLFEQQQPKAEILLSLLWLCSLHTSGSQSKVDSPRSQSKEE